MKIRALGTGSSYCRHPLTPPSFLVYTDGAVISIGAPYQLPTRLAGLGDEDKLSMVVLLSPFMDQIGGLYEIAFQNRKVKNKPVLASTAAIIREVTEKLEKDLPFKLSESFDIKCITKVSFEEEHFTETMTLIPNYGKGGACAIRFENAKVLITGAAPLNEDWLHRNIDCDLILHQIDDTDTGASSCPTLDEIQQLPLYMQTKIWLYGYGDVSKDVQPFPMMFVTPLAWVYNSWRKQKAMSKERVIKENAAKQLANS